MVVAFSFNNIKVISQCRVTYRYCICTRLGQVFSMRSSISAALAAFPCTSSKCAQCRCRSGLSRWCTVQARSNTSRSTPTSSGLVSTLSSKNLISCKEKLL